MKMQMGSNNVKCTMLHVNSIATFHQVQVAVGTLACTFTKEIGMCGAGGGRCSL